MIQDKDISDRNLFMMCESLRVDALSDIPVGYHVRCCKKEELDLWKAIHFDHEEDHRKYAAYMTSYFEAVYRPQEELFWNSCRLMCDKNDTPVGTCFAWKAYGSVTTIHWFKIKKQFEGKGLGRALLSAVMKDIASAAYPVFLHTQPESFRAIKLYHDFGFAFVTDEKVGFRTNDLISSLPYLKERMPEAVFKNLKFSTAPEYFLTAVQTSEVSQF